MVFQTIVVGVDGGAGGVDAMALARRLGAPGSELIAVAIAAVDPQPTRKVNPDFDRDAREEAHERLVDLRAQEPDLRTEVLRSSWVGAGLHDAARRFDADLIVVGSCRRGLIGRVFAGDDTRDTLRGAPCPVAVATRDFALGADRPIASIGLGWAEDATSDDALALARALAADTDAQLHVLTVRAQPSGEGDGFATDARVADEAERVASRAAALAGLEATTTTGAPAHELARFAGEVDLLIVGSQQRGPLGRIVLGSVSEQLTRDCPRPLLVVPRAHRHVGRA